MRWIPWNMKKLKEQQTDQLIIGNLGPLQKQNLESSSQLVKTIATHSPSEDCALAGVQGRVAVWILRWSWKNPTGWKGLGIPDIIVCNYYSTVYIIYDINLHYVYTIYILRIPLVNEFACLNMFDWTRSELWRFPRYARYSPTFRDSFQFKEFKKVSFQDGLDFQCIWSFATHQAPSPTRCVFPLLPAFLVRSHWDRQRLSCWSYNES